MGDLNYELNRLALTTGLDAAGAANIYAGTVGKELVGALNSKAGTSGLELVGVANKLAGTTGLDLLKALQAIATPSSWTPASITGIVEYWDFSDTSKITAVANAVSSVTGALGVYNLAQGTAANKPKSGTTTIGSLNALDFDATDYLSVTITSVAQPLTYLAVYKNTVNSGRAQRIIDTSGRVLYDASLDTSASKRAMYAGSTIVGSVGVTSAEQAVVVFNGASSQTWIGGTSDITGNPGATATGTGFFVASDATSGSYLGQIGFIGLLSQAMSAGDRALWNTYCARWGL